MFTWSKMIKGLDTKSVEKVLKFLPEEVKLSTNKDKNIKKIKQLENGLALVKEITDYVGDETNARKIKSKLAEKKKEITNRVKEQVQEETKLERKIGKKEILSPVETVKTILESIVESKNSEVGITDKLVIEILEILVKSTKNKLDDKIVKAIKTYLETKSILKTIFAFI